MIQIWFQFRSFGSLSKLIWEGHVCSRLILGVPLISARWWFPLLSSTPERGQLSVMWEVGSPPAPPQPRRPLQEFWDLEEARNVASQPFRFLSASSALLRGVRRWCQSKFIGAKTNFLLKILCGRVFWRALVLLLHVLAGGDCSSASVVNTWSADDHIEQHESASMAAWRHTCRSLWLSFLHTSPIGKAVCERACPAVTW